MNKLTIIIPVYNEKNTLKELISRVKGADIGSVEKEIILVDDFSTDGSREMIKNLKIPGIKKVFNEKNRGKGGSIKNGILHSTGDLIIFQDADLEYNPSDYKKLIEPLLKKEVDFVLGERPYPKFFSKENKIPLHWLGNKLLSIIGNLLYSTNLRDYEPCYKVFRREVLINTPIKSERFEYDIELMAKLFRKKFKFKVVPIEYAPRSFEEGKKLNWKDGVIAIFTLFKWRIVD